MTENPTTSFDFTVGIPVWNEELILESNLERLCAHLDLLGSYEIIIVNNGSTDRSVELTQHIASENPRVRGFELPQQDVAGAFRTMARKARSDFLICLDMDLSADLSFVDEALRLLPQHDLVIGSKKLGDQNRSWLRKLGSNIYVACAHWLLGLGVEDYSMGAKAYRLPFFRPLLDRVGRGTSYVVNCIFLAHQLGGRLVEIPIHCRDLRRSRFNLPQEALHKFSHLLSLWLRCLRANIQFWGPSQSYRTKDPQNRLRVTPLGHDSPES